MTPRFATEDTEIGGVRIPAGTAIWPVMGAANRDPEQFKDSDTFDITRDPNDHLAFGEGVHFCIGRREAYDQDLGRLRRRSIFSRASRGCGSCRASPRPIGAPRCRAAWRRCGSSSDSETRQSRLPYAASQQRLGEGLFFRHPRFIVGGVLFFPSLTFCCGRGQGEGFGALQAPHWARASLLLSRSPRYAIVTVRYYLFTTINNQSL